MDNNRLITLNGAEYVDIATLDEQRRVPIIKVAKPSLSSDKIFTGDSSLINALIR